MIVSFGTLASLAGVTVTDQTNTTIPSTYNVTNNVLTVDLHSVLNPSRLTISLNGVSDGVDSVNINIPMGILLGDVDASTRVDGNDVSAVQSHTRQPTDATNFRDDVDATGRIDGNDVSMTQAHTRTALPSPP